MYQLTIRPLCFLRTPPRGKLRCCANQTRSMSADKRRGVEGGCLTNGYVQPAGRPRLFLLSSTCFGPQSKVTGDCAVRLRKCLLKPLCRQYWQQRNCGHNWAHLKSTSSFVATAFA
ncbi:hypothetical protein BaRGS_00000820 [Batillaria attramentaria]|uniref:Uncharacterized protein n=1 Tax=Batillaria attramentaria TaxID=370345 RepID=A0ABD0M8L7_9CAEN